MGTRLSVIRDAADPALAGRVVVVGATRDHDLTDLPRDTSILVQPFFPDHAFAARAGFQVQPEWPEAADTAIVFLPRAKALALQWIAQAARICSGTIIIDGQKTDGIDSILKTVKKHTAIQGSVSKAHGKLFWCAADPALAGLAPQNVTEADGFTVAPGVFSADGIDPASRALAKALPEKLGARVADLGAGWGYLSSRILQAKGLTHLHVVEADHIALTCARANLNDDRTVFHWADATEWRPDRALDSVVMNPPFHTGRAATPDLGQAFIRNAARCLAPKGRLWLVANRHLPYEQTLDAGFARVETLATAGGFKVMLAAHPKRHV